MRPPPDSHEPTVAMLQADIDSGRTGDKNPVFDPSLAPLGTDDEAAGHPPSPARVAEARRLEGLDRWLNGSRAAAAAHDKRDGLPIAFIGFIVAVGAILIAGISRF